MRLKTTMLAALLAAAVGGASARPAAATDITLFRFFGDCANDFGSTTDLSKAVDECGAIQVLTNKFNAENKIGAKVVTQTVDWHTYYDLLSASYSTGNVPDVAIMHRSLLPNFASRGLIDPIGDDLKAAGVDFADFVPEARKAVTLGGKVYALPFDIHAVLFHVNMDLMRQAGLTTAAGDPVLPASPEDLLAQGKTLKQATGKIYLGLESDSAGVMPDRLFESWLWQQGQDVVKADGSAAELDTAAGLKAADLFQQIYAQGLSNKAFDYAGAEQAFLNGEVAILVNGTWAVDKYSAQVAGGTSKLRNYRVANLPKLFASEAVWSDSHTWTIPTNPNRSPEAKAAALAFIKFLDDNDGAWARTGHLPVRQSVLASDAFKKLPHRSEYVGTASIARALPPIQNQRGIQDVMVSGLSAVWLTGQDPKAALAGMQSRVDRILKRSH